MKYYSFIGALVLFCLPLHAQNVDFVFNKELNNLVTLKEGGSPYVFEILSEKHTTTIKKPATKKVSEFYKKALAYVDKAKNDSQRIAQLKKESKYTPEIAKELNVTEVNNRLRAAKRILKKTKKYEFVPSKTIVQEHENFKMRRSIFKPQNIVVGQFKYIGSYYVTNGADGYADRDLISVADAEQHKLTTEHFLLDNVFEVIQNVETNTIYMVYPDFLEKYAINQIAAQNKYKGKIGGINTFSSNNDVDKKLDALIIEYNRKLIKLI